MKVTKEFSHTERFLSLFTTLRPGEGPPTLLLAAQAFALMSSIYLLKVIRDTLILSFGDAHLKAYATALQSGLLIFIVPIFARAYFRTSRRNGKHQLFRHILLFFLTNLLLFAFLYWKRVDIAFVFYVWHGLFSVMSVALFWSFAADLFNLKSGQRLFPIFAAAAALGAYTGAASTAWLEQITGPGGVLCCAGLLLLLPILLCVRMEHAVPAGSMAILHDSDNRPPGSLSQGFDIVLRNPYLSLIAVMVILLNLVNTNGEFVLASLVTDEISRTGMDSGTASARGEFITDFYSRYQSITALLGFLIQLFLVSRIYEWVGLRGALVVLPLVMVVGYGLLIFVPVLAFARIVMIAENSISYSLTATTRHALFLPVSREEKYVGKQAIDTFFLRLGDLLSGGLVFLGSSVLGLTVVAFIIGNIFLGVLLFILVVWIGRYHYRTVQRNLGNLPPVVTFPIEDLSIQPGAVTEIVFDRDTFLDPDEGDALRYMAYLNESDELPPWVEFDGLSRKFTFSPAQSDSGRISLRVVARDYDGLTTESRFLVHISGSGGSDGDGAT